MTNPTTDLTELRLKSKEERRIKAGHLWVFSNEVDTARTPLTQFDPGQTVRIVCANGKPLGHGYVNPHSLICARIMDRDVRVAIDRSLLVHRLKVALSLRERLFKQPFYRLVFGEADGLPGLVVDRFDRHLVVQVLTAGMERLRDELVEALQKVINPTSILFRNDSAIRLLEGLEQTIEQGLGDTPQAVELEENGVRFRTNVHSGQKTGWFFDHRQNRARLKDYVAGKSVLDVFSYSGAWGIQAAVFGADRVTCIDRSEPALQALQENAAMNKVESKVDAVCADAFEQLKRLREQRQRFDIVVLDPPALIKKRKDVKAGTLAYRRLNELAMRVLSRDGILVSASCSFHLGSHALRQLLLAGSRHLDRNLLILEQGHQSMDHPIHPAIAETEYLKAIFCRVLPT